MSGPRPGELAEQYDWREDENINRPRGILSPKERAHLFGRLDEDPEEDAHAIRQREYRIRQHLRHAIIDFFYLARREIAQQVLADLGRDGEVRTEEQESLFFGARAMLYFLYSTLGASSESDEYSTFSWLLTEVIADSLVQRYADEGISVVPTVRFDIHLGEKVPIEDLKSVYDQYPEKWLLSEELHALLRSGVITGEENNEYIQKMNEKEKEPQSEEFQEKKAAAYRRRGYEVKWNQEGSYRLQLLKEDS